MTEVMTKKKRGPKQIYGKMPYRGPQWVPCGPNVLAHTEHWVKEWAKEVK